MAPTTASPSARADRRAAVLSAACAALMMAFPGFAQDDALDDGRYKLRVRTEGEFIPEPGSCLEARLRLEENGRRLAKVDAYDLSLDPVKDAAKKKRAGELRAQLLNFIELDRVKVEACRHEAPDLTKLAKAIVLRGPARLNDQPLKTGELRILKHGDTICADKDASVAVQVEEDQERYIEVRGISCLTLAGPKPDQTWREYLLELRKRQRQSRGQSPLPVKG